MKLSTLSEARYTSGGLPKEFEVPVTISGEDVRKLVIEYWCDGHENLYEEMIKDPVFVHAITKSVDAIIKNDPLQTVENEFKRSGPTSYMSRDLADHVYNRMREVSHKLEISQ